MIRPGEMPYEPNICLYMVILPAQQSKIVIILKEALPGSLIGVEYLRLATCNRQPRQVLRLVRLAITS